MALNNLEERVQRSIFEHIRLIILAEGYIPDITNLLRYPVELYNPNVYTPEALANWEDDIKTIKDAMGFAIEIFGDSSQWEKGEKNYPRISIESTRTVPGELGAALSTGYEQDPDDSTKLNKVITDWNAVHLQFDVTLTAKTAKEKRILNAILSKALGVVRHIPFFDSDEIFFVRQYGFFNIYAEDKGLSEKIYSFEVTDLFLTAEFDDAKVTKINQIDIDLIPTNDTEDLNSESLIKSQEILEIKNT